jgi:hypothetical protein
MNEKATGEPQYAAMVPYPEALRIVLDRARAL